ncbi:MAG: ATP-binding protein [Desulfobulbaceae bacterium]|nr:ATP-binding protein [Desulfobulbaceae bacterium]
MMSPSELSIRQKITLGYFSLIFVVIVIALTTYGITAQVEKKVVLVEVIDDFYNLTLECRRFEKNYFLYAMETDFADNFSYLKKLEDILELHGRVVIDLSSVGELGRIEQIMSDYRKKMEELHAFNNASPGAESIVNFEILQATIRELGKKMTDFAENTAKAERDNIKRLLKASRSIFLSSMVALIFLSFVMATLMGRKVVASLKLLEDYTLNIAHGEMLDPPSLNVEREIRSLFHAFQRMVNELRLRQRQIVQSEKLAAMGTLVAGVAHELNNPLSNISTSAQILLEEIDNNDKEFQKNLLLQIEGQTDKGRNIVRTLLDFSVNKKFTKEKFSFEDLVRQTIQLLRSEMKSGIKIHLEFPDDSFVFADKQGMQQVLLNLIKNSIDALGTSGNIWIQVAGIQNDNLGREIEIMVEDDGPGIEPSILANIFDPFFTTKDVGQGSGIGLFVVHEIIEAHNGKITVDSRIDQGTTFIIWLPVHEVRE